MAINNKMPAYPKKREAICGVCGHYKKGQAKILQPVAQSFLY